MHFIYIYDSMLVLELATSILFPYNNYTQTVGRYSSMDLSHIETIS